MATSNSPFLTPVTNADHSSRSNTCAALRTFLESRTATLPSARCATSTQPSELQARLRIHRAALGSCVIGVSFRWSNNFPGELADEVGGVGGGQTRRARQAKGLGPGTYGPLPLEVGLPGDTFRIYDIRVKSLRKFNDRERTVEAWMRSAAERQHLQRDIRPQAGVSQVIQLPPHKLRRTHRPADHCFVQDEPQLYRIGAQDHLLALHPQRDEAFNLLGRLPPAHRGHYHPGVRLGLQQAVNHQRLIGAQRGGLGLQASLDVEAGGQNVLPRCPPALTVTVTGHVHEDLASTRIVDAVKIEHGRQVCGPGRGLARLDPRERGCGQAELLSNLLQLYRMRLAQSS